MDHKKCEDLEGQINEDNMEEEEKLKQIRSSSQSVPTSITPWNAAKATGRVVSLVPPDQVSVAAAGKEAPEEAEDMAAAVCRICMVALSSEKGGSSTGSSGGGVELGEAAALELECRCKGDLALAHRGCAVRWFRIKGNGACDICGQEVLNLPLTFPAAHQSTTQQQDDGASSTGSSTAVCHGAPLLVIATMLAYFCFLEQLLLHDHGVAALAISLPFACVIGLFSSLTTPKRVSVRYAWIHSAAQFLVVVLLAHLLYGYVRMQAVIAVIVSTFAGFGVASCSSSVVLRILRRRASCVASPTAADLEMALPQP